MKIEFRVWDKNKRKMLYLYPNDTILFKNGKCSVWKENQYDKFEECCCCEVYSNVIPMCEIDRLANPVDFEVIGNIYENPELLKKNG